MDWLDDQYGNCKKKNGPHQLDKPVLTGTDSKAVAKEQQIRFRRNKTRVCTHSSSGTHHLHPSTTEQSVVVPPQPPPTTAIIPKPDLKNIFFFLKTLIFIIAE